VIKFKKAIYCDACTLLRPYDDQTYPRIEAETAAVILINSHIKAGKFELFYSPVLVREIERNADELEKIDILTLLAHYGKNAAQSRGSLTKIWARGKEFRDKGMMTMGDSLHAAYAEQVNASLITCDDGIIKKMKKIDTKIWYGTPVDFCIKEGLL